MLLYFANRLDRSIHARPIAQQHALVDPNRLTLGGALGYREVLRAEIEPFGKQFRHWMIFGRGPKQRVVIHRLVAG